MGCYKDNSNPITCCHDCKERFPACHDVCATYLREREKWIEIKNKANIARVKESVYDRYHYGRVQDSRKEGRAKGKVY